MCHKEKSQGILFGAKKLVTKKYGAAPKIIKFVYTGTARTIMAYACFVWIHKFIGKKTKLRGLKKLQRVGFNMITGCSPFAPTVALEFILNIEDLEIFLVCVALKTRLRLIISKHWSENPQALKGHTRWLDLKAGVDRANIDSIADSVFH